LSGRDAVFEPLHGKGRPLRESLSLLVERWKAGPLGDEDLGALEEALHHLFRRAQVRRTLPSSADPVVLAREFLRALREGRGREAVAALDASLPLTSPTTPTGRGPRPSGT
jgi:hypothetical protein